MEIASEQSRMEWRKFTGSVIRQMRMFYQKNAAVGNSVMILTGDRTSGANISRAIFEKRADGNWCVVLTSPPVASLVPLIEKGKGKRPVRWKTSTQASAGFPETRVIYVWSREKRIYKPNQCYLKSGRNISKSIDCSDAYK